MRDPSRKGHIQIVVEKVRVNGAGAILLTGPSSCGKGEIARALSRFLSFPPEKHLSMGSLLRDTVEKARADAEFRTRLAHHYGISDTISVFDPALNRPEVVHKALSHRAELEAWVGRGPGPISQLEWLEYCVIQGLLVPDEWSERIIDAAFRSTSALHRGIFILDGYPRTVVAAEHILKLFEELDIPIISVLHLSITKQEMKKRALGRGRIDDTEENLERRYQFYVERVQPCIDYLKQRLGAATVSLIDAHRPVYEDGKLNVPASIQAVTLEVLQALGLPGFLLDLEPEEEQGLSR